MKSFKEWQTDVFVQERIDDKFEKLSPLMSKKERKIIKSMLDENCTKINDEYPLRNPNVSKSLKDMGFE